MEVNDAIKWVGDLISNWSSAGIQKLSEYGANPSPILSKLIPLFFGALLVFLGSKVSGKVAKWVSILLGIIIIVAVGYSFIP